jgi:uncharacterized protein with GYD domain
MPIYVTLLKFTSEGLKSMADFGKAWEEGRERADQIGIKSVGAYGLLGRYDMMFIYEAPDEKVAAGMPLSFAPRGDAQTETWTAIPMEEFAQIAARLKG